MDKVCFKHLHLIDALTIMDTPEILATCIAREYLNIDIDSLDQRGLTFLYSTVPSEVLSIELILRFSEGYSGKNGFEVYRIKFKGIMVGYLRAEGLWTDEYTFFLMVIKM